MRHASEQDAISSVLADSAYHRCLFGHMSSCAVYFAAVQCAACLLLCMGIAHCGQALCASFCLGTPSICTANFAPHACHEPDSPWRCSRKRRGSCSRPSTTAHHNRQRAVRGYGFAGIPSNAPRHSAAQHDISGLRASIPQADRHKGLTRSCHHRNRFGCMCGRLRPCDDFR